MKKIIIICTVVLIFLNCNAVFGTEFHDVTGTKYENAVDYIVEKGIINGFDNNTYMPYQNVTRAQMAKIIVKAINYENNVDIKSKFTDILDSHWAKQYVYGAQNLNIITGYPDGTFQPDRSVSYAEVTAIILRAFEMEDKVKHTNLNWPDNYIEVAQMYDLYDQISDFEKDATATRGNVAIMLHNALIQFEKLQANSEIYSEFMKRYEGDLVNFNNKAILGAERAGKEQYIANMVKTINIVKDKNIINNLTIVDKWDISEQNDDSIILYLTENKLKPYFDIYIISEKIMILEDASAFFASYENCQEITGFENIDTSLLSNTYYMFYKCEALEEVDLKPLNTQKVIDMGYMFSQCTKMKKIDISTFNTSNVKNMKGMFALCGTLTTLDLNSFDTQNAADMSVMFSGCKNLEKLNIARFDTKNVIDMHYMFSSCESMKELDLHFFNTQNVTDMSVMFSGCKNLENLNISGFNTKNVVNMNWMFLGCAKLRKLDLSSFNTEKVTSMKRMFEDCVELEELNIMNFDTRNVIKSNDIFKGCNNLTNKDELIKKFFCEK